MNRNEKMLAMIDPSSQQGLEIGPLCNPIVTHEMGWVRYVDHATTEELKRKCSAWGTYDIDRIVHVDYVWGEKSLSELTLKEMPFDYVIASHVIEHVPDFIGWLKEIHAVLKPGGILSLAIPDKRYTFDYFRQLTKPSDVIDAYLHKNKKPSVRQVFDYHSEFVSKNEKSSWTHYGTEKELVRYHSLDYAWETTLDTFESGKYTDVHCWVFTESSFIDLLEILMKLKLVDFKIGRVFDRHDVEFFVNLEAMDVAISFQDRLKQQLDSVEAARRHFCRPLRNLMDLRSWRITRMLIGLIKQLKRS